MISRMCGEREDATFTPTFESQESAGRRAPEREAGGDYCHGGMRGAARVALGLLACAAPVNAFTGGAAAAVSGRAFSAANVLGLGIRNGVHGHSHAGVCSRQLVSAPLLGGSIALHCSTEEGITPRGSKGREARGAARAQTGQKMGRADVAKKEKEDAVPTDAVQVRDPRGPPRPLFHNSTVTMSRKEAQAGGVRTGPAGGRGQGSAGGGLQGKPRGGRQASASGSRQDTARGGRQGSVRGGRQGSIEGFKQVAGRGSSRAGGRRGGGRDKNEWLSPKGEGGSDSKGADSNTGGAGTKEGLMGGKGLPDTQGDSGDSYWIDYSVIIKCDARPAPPPKGADILKPLCRQLRGKS
jgi:hypothetical protein